MRGVLGLGSKTACFFFLVFAWAVGLSQAPSLFLNRFSPEGKFDNQPINSIHQDRAGYLWIGTFSGLFKYDGLALTHYTHDAKDPYSLLNNNVSKVVEDKFGQLWLLTESGLNCLDPVSEQFHSWLKINFKGLALTPRGDLLGIDREEQVIWRIKPKANQGADIDIQPLIKSADLGSPQGKRIRFMTLAVDRHSQIWIGTNRGLWLTEGAGKYTQVTQREVNSLAVSNRDEKLWIGEKGPRVTQMILSEEGRPLKGQIQSIELTQEPRVWITDIVAEGSQLVWVATTQGLYRISLNAEPDKQVEFFEADESRLGALPSNRVLALYQDRNQNLLIGTLQGMRQVRKQPFSLSYEKLTPDDYVLLNQIIHTSYEDEYGRLWVGTANDGLFCRPNPEARFIKIPMPGNTCRDIKLSSEGDLWVLSDGTCWAWPMQRNLESALSRANWSNPFGRKNNLRSLLELSDGRIFLGYWRTGLRVLSAGDHLELPSPLAPQEAANPEFHVEALVEDNHGGIWVGTRGYGLYHLDKQGKILAFHSLGAEAGEIAYGVLDILKDSRGQLWVATRGGGIFAFASDGKPLAHYGMAEGLPATTICGLIEDQLGSIWASTENGLSLYLPEEPIPFISFGASDGILNSHFNFGAIDKGPKGQLYFGSKNGLYTLTPKLLSRKSDNPPLQINQVVLFSTGDEDLSRQSYEVMTSAQLQAQPLTLDHHQSSVELGFSALDFTAPEKVRFAYRLLGYEQDWHYTSSGNQQARYLNLPAGKYQFQLKSSDSKGRWSGQIENLILTVLPSFWETSWAYLLYGLLGCALLVGIVVVIRRWEHLKARLRRASQERARQDSSLSYFSDLSHEIRNRLTLIMGPLERVLAENNGQQVKRETVERIYQNALRLKRLTDEIMNLRKGDLGAFRLRAGRGDIRAFLQRIKQDMDEVARLKKVDYQFFSAEEELLAWFDQELVEIIVLNLLSNAFKYTTEEGMIQLRTSAQALTGTELPNWNLAEGDYIRIQVIDNGQGIPQEDIAQIFEPYFQSDLTKDEKVEGSGLGLDLVVRLIQLHHGAIVAQSKPGERTTITCWIPRTRSLYAADELQPLVSVETQEPLPSSAEPTGEEALQDEFPLVLVAEDDAELRQMLIESLGGEFRVCAVGNGKEGYQMAQKLTPDLILSDMIMPEADGLTFLKWIRKDAELSDVPFVVLTARYSEEQRLASIQHQADDFLEKPFRMEFLRWRIRNLLHSRNRLREKYRRVITAEPKEVIVESAEDQFIQQVVDLMEEHMSSSWLSVEFLASELSMSRATFYRRMEEIMQDSPSNFIKQFRLKRAVQLLQQRRFNISEVSYQTGFKNPRYFSKCFQREFGMSPSAYVKSMEPATIEDAI